MAAPTTPESPPVEKQHRLAAWFVMACGGVAGLLAIANLLRPREGGWDAIDPWTKSASVVIPAAIVLLAVAMLSSGAKKRIFGAIAMTLALAGLICALN
ncbi:MAG: hypothetical protein RIC55_08625 [Pirellulaceae bacterium]